jgi:hypothetical protein
MKPKSATRWTGAEEAADGYVPTYSFRADSLEGSRNKTQFYRYLNHIMREHRAGGRRSALSYAHAFLSSDLSQIAISRSVDELSLASLAFVPPMKSEGKYEAQNGWSD